MNKFLKVLIITILLPLTVVSSAFMAQTLHLDAQVSAEQSTLQQRVEQYKAKLQTQPSKTDLDKLKLRCSVAQDRLKSLSERISKVHKSRTEGYASINKTLEELTIDLKAKNISVTKLEEQNKQLKAKTDTFSSDITAYKQSIDDAVALDCAADPLALKAAIIDAANYNVKIIPEVADIRNHINNVTKVTLKQIKDDLVVQRDAKDNQAPIPAPDQATQPGGGSPNATE